VSENNTPVGVVRGCPHAIIQVSQDKFRSMQLAQSSLVTRRRNVPPARGSRWGPKQRRAYQRLLSGLNLAAARNQVVRIITLTTVPGPGYQGLRHPWQALRKRIERRFKAKVNYWRLRTNEGARGVLHILYVGPWIPQSWLSRAWRDLVGAPIVYIQMLKKRRGSRRIANYMISNYMMHHQFMRQSWSWGWVFRGFVGAWKQVLRISPTLVDAIITWNRQIRTGDPEHYLKVLFGDAWVQTRLKKRLGSLVDVVI